VVISKITTAKTAAGMAKVKKCLPHKALSSNYQKSKKYLKKKKRKK
jgi:translation elongation factor EF-Ts